MALFGTLQIGSAVYSLMGEKPQQELYSTTELFEQADKKHSQKYGYCILGQFLGMGGLLISSAYGQNKR